MYFFAEEFTIEFVQKKFPWKAWIKENEHKIERKVSAKWIQKDLAKFPSATGYDPNEGAQAQTKTLADAKRSLEQLQTEDEDSDNDTSLPNGSHL